MRVIDLDAWPRRRQFEFYSGFDYPHFNLCAEVEIGALHSEVKRRGLSFGVTVAYLLARGANEISEFRTRIRGKEVVEHEVVHPSITVLGSDDLFSFCTIPYRPALDEFALRAAEQIFQVRANPTLEDPPGRDDLLFMTGIPWVHFTGLMHPIHMHPVDSVPRIAWGKFEMREGGIQMPLAVQGHHGLMDGLHVGRYFIRVQQMANQPHLLFETGASTPQSTPH